MSSVLILAIGTEGVPPLNIFVTIAGSLTLPSKKKKKRQPFKEKRRKALVSQNPKLRNQQNGASFSW